MTRPLRYRTRLSTNLSQSPLLFACQSIFLGKIHYRPHAQRLKPSRWCGLHPKTHYLISHGRSDSVNTSTLLSIYRNPSQAIICSQNDCEDDKEFETLFWEEYKGSNGKGLAETAAADTAAEGLLTECEQCGQSMTLRQWSKHSGSCTELVCTIFKQLMELIN